MGLEKDIRKKAKKGNTREVAAHEKRWFSVLTWSVLFVMLSLVCAVSGMWLDGESGTKMCELLLFWEYASQMVSLFRFCKCAWEETLVLDRNMQWVTSLFVCRVSRFAFVSLGWHDQAFSLCLFSFLVVSQFTSKHKGLACYDQQRKKEKAGFN